MYILISVLISLIPIYFFFSKLIEDSIKKKFDISDYGFLRNPSVKKLPLKFKDFFKVIENINNPDCVKFRKLVNNLPVYHRLTIIELFDDLSRDELKLIYTIFTFICQKYIRGLGKLNQIDTLPYTIGAIWHYSANKLEIQPTTTYTALILNNWYFNGPEELENIEPLFNITNDKNEIGFYKIHMYCEYLGSKIVNGMCKKYTDAGLTKFLEQYAQDLFEIKDYISKMKDFCDHEIFWTKIRIFLSGYDRPSHGIPDGLKIQGTNIVLKYSGGSGSSSVLFQSFDKYLGIKHSTHSSDFMKRMEEQMLPTHRNFLEYIEKNSIKNQVLKSKSKKLKEAYNKCHNAFDAFRTMHISLVHVYITKYNQMIKDAKETGDIETLKKLTDNDVTDGNGTGGIGRDSEPDAAEKELVAIKSSVKKNKILF